MTALLTLMWKKREQQHDGEKKYALSGYYEDERLHPLYIFFLSKNTQSTMLYSRNFTVK